jgi:2-keto-4-pentenoate hydratase/2-oxohepta-3-ene-1,7-dioic acid hydratase in catechol pathway
MRLCRFNDERFGLVVGDNVLDVTPALSGLQARRYPFPEHDILIESLPSLRNAIEAVAKTAPARALKDVKLHSPVANPGKIVAAPVNYLRHLEEAHADPEIHHQNQIHEIQRVGLFLKATSSVAGPSAPLIIRHPDRRTDHEIELAAVIGKRADRVKKEDALSYVAGYCIGFDITVRGPEERSLRKSVDGYTVLGPWLVTADELPDPSGLAMHLKVNGETRQKANTKDLVIDVPSLIEFASSYYTLMPGDVILTGTPEGVGPIAPGDVLDATIGKIGAMRVQVAK